MVEHHQMLRDDWIKSQFWSVDYELLSWPPTVFEALVQSGLMHAETSRKDIQLFKAAYEKQHQVPARSDSVKPELCTAKVRRRPHVTRWG